MVICANVIAVPFAMEIVVEIVADARILVRVVVQGHAIKNVQTPAMEIVAIHVQENAMVDVVAIVLDGVVRVHHVRAHVILHAPEHAIYNVLDTVDHHAVADAQADVILHVKVNVWVVADVQDVAHHAVADRVNHNVLPVAVVVHLRAKINVLNYARVNV